MKKKGRTKFRGKSQKVSLKGKEASNLGLDWATRGEFSVLQSVLFSKLLRNLFAEVMPLAYLEVFERTFKDLKQ